jgi:hypothetical protein
MQGTRRIIKVTNDENYTKKIYIFWERFIVTCYIRPQLRYFIRTLKVPGLNHGPETDYIHQAIIQTLHINTGSVIIINLFYYLFICVI